VGKEINMSTALFEKNAIDSTSLISKHIEYNPVIYDLAELAEIKVRELLPWIIISSRPVTYRESFIGMLTNEEADEMREKLKIFKKRFNDDFAKKHQILFGH